jgi:hypothetical protein
MRQNLPNQDKLNYDRIAHLTGASVALRAGYRKQPGFTDLLVRVSGAKGWLLWLLFVACLGAMTAAPAVASHFKGGQITYEDQQGGTYLVTFKSYWRSNAVGSVNPAYSGDHVKESVLATVSYTILPDGITTEVVQRQTVTWAQPGLYTISWTSCCRLRGGSNFQEGSIGLFAAVNYNPEQPSSSAQFYDLPLFNFTSSVPLRFSFNSIDPEGHGQEYVLSTPHGTKDNLYSRMIETGFGVSETGEIFWENPQKGIWLVNVKLSEKIDGQFTGAYVFRDFMLYVSEESNTAPVFAAISAKEVPEESLLLFEVRATDAEGQAVKLRANGVPLGKGATFEQTVFESTAAGTFSWTPPKGAKGRYTIQFTATDNASFALSSQITVSIEVTACQAQLLTLGTLDEVCVNAAAFALDDPFGSGTFFGPGMVGGIFSPAQAGVGTHIITCTYTEGNCTHVSTQEITVIPAPVADAGPDRSIFAGYGRPAYVVLEATVGDTDSPAIRWSNGSVASSIKVWPVQTTTYTLSVTGSNGCTTEDEVTVQVQDISCGQSKDMVQLCLDGNTLCVTQGAVATYLARGAVLGPCGSRQIDSGQDRLVQEEEKHEIAFFSVYPNPMESQHATVAFMLDREVPYTVEVYSLQGVRIARLEEGLGQPRRLYQIPLNAGLLPSGLYLTRLVAGDQVQHLKVINAQGLR